MRQQRTNQVRRAYDRSDQPQYPVIQWGVNMVGGNVIALQPDGGLANVVLSGVVPLFCEELGEYPVSQTVVGPDLHLTYAGVPQYGSSYTIAGQVDELRSRFGGRLAQKTSPDQTATPVFSWQVDSILSADTIRLIATSGNPPFAVFGVPALVDTTAGNSAVSSAQSGNDIDVAFSGPVSSGDFIDLGTPSAAWRDVNGAEMGPASQPVP